MITISDIAKATGMARTTVAEILRHKPGYNEKTRQRVLKVAQELNYRPNYLSKALAGGKSMTIGLVMASIDTPITSFKVIAIEAKARQHGYLTYLAGWGEADRQPGQYLKDILARRVDGLIVYRIDPLPQESQIQLDQTKVPVVYLDWAPPKTACVQIDRQKGIDALVAHLASLGHQRIAFLCQDYNRQFPAHKAEKYAQACQKNNVQFIFDDDWSLGEHPYDPEVMTQTLKRGLAQKNPPTAIVADNDQMAGLAIGCLQDCGLNVPGDISVAGFDDLPLAKIPRPQLTTIRQPRHLPGDAVFDMLLKRMEQPQTPIISQTFDCELIIRNSTAPPRKFPLARPSPRK